MRIRRVPIPVPLASQSCTALCFTALLVAGSAWAGAPRSPSELPPPNGAEDPPLTVRDDSAEPEELVVTETRFRPGKVLPYEYMQLVHDSRAKGACLYKRGDYDEAFPYLLAAAKRGFKIAQARVGFLHQVGWGTHRDPYAAVGWLSVAAQGKSHPEIQHYFEKVWRRIPDEHMPRFESIVDSYRSSYGARRHRVVCDRSGTYLKSLSCRFMDEAIYDDWQPVIDALSGKPIFETALSPVRPNRKGC